MLRRAALLVAVLVVAAMSTPANAFHFYRGPGGGCTPTDGHTTDDPAEPAPGPVTATVMMTHNLFVDEASHTNETHVKVGEAVRWTWNSSHCHSTQASGGEFNSGFHYPTAPPESPLVVPGFFEYPVLDSTPTLDFTHTFRTPGTYSYFCVHHEIIGMSGRVVVES